LGGTCCCEPAETTDVCGWPVNKQSITLSSTAYNETCPPHSKVFPQVSYNINDPKSTTAPFTMFLTSAHTFTLAKKTLNMDWFIQ
jgi:hypothetical protein